MFYLYTFIFYIYIFIISQIMILSIITHIFDIFHNFKKMDEISNRIYSKMIEQIKKTLIKWQNS